jgi:undecaprenyl-diphosphatase
MPTRRPIDTREPSNAGRTSWHTTNERFLAHPGRAIRLAAGLLALVALLALLVPTEPLAIERSWSEAMQDIQAPLLKDIALVFNWLGRGIGRALTLGALGLILLLARRLVALLAFAVAESLAPLLSSLLKAATNRPRPPDGLVHPAGSAFPSGHATYAGATCVALVLLFTAPSPRRRWWWMLATLGILGMAWSRTYLHVHWLTDVIAGSLLGIAVSLLVFATAQQVSTTGSSGSRSSDDPSAPVPPLHHANGVEASRVPRESWCEPLPRFGWRATLVRFLTNASAIVCTHPTHDRTSPLPQRPPSARLARTGRGS